MKRLFGFFLLLFGLAVFLLNYESSQTVNKTKSTKLELRNVNALQASAGELWCDQSNNAPCTITMGDVTGISIGILRGTP